MSNYEQESSQYTISSETAADIVFGQSIDAQQREADSAVVLSEIQENFLDIPLRYQDNHIFRMQLLKDLLRNEQIIQQHPSIVMTPDQRRVLLKITIGSAIETTDKTMLAYKDEKTGTWSKSVFDAELNHLLDKRAHYEETERRTRTNTEIAVFIVDLDDFKALNKQILYSGGDKKLIGVANILSSQFRPTDTIAHPRKYIEARNSKNADEFFGLNINFSFEDRGFLHERLIRVQELVEQELGITISCGYTFVRAEDKTAEDVINRANENLNRAKARKNAIEGDLQEI